MHTEDVTLHCLNIKLMGLQFSSSAMGVFNKVKTKIQSAEDKLVMKMPDDFYKNADKPETDRERKMKEYHL